MRIRKNRLSAKQYHNQASQKLYQAASTASDEGTAPSFSIQTPKPVTETGTSDAIPNDRSLVMSEWMPPFSPPDPAAAFSALQKLYQNYQCEAVYRNPLTGLPSFIEGDLGYSGGDEPALAVAYLKEYELALAGIPRGTRLRQVSASRWGDGTYQITFNQTNSADIPIHGGNVICNFQNGKLTLITSHLYPAPLSIIDRFDLSNWSDDSWLTAKGVAHDFWPEAIKLRDETPYIAPQDLRTESFDKNWIIDRWVLPYQAAPNKLGTYRPVWRVLMIDQDNQSWEVFIDAETEEILSYTLSSLI